MQKFADYLYIFVIFLLHIWLIFSQEQQETGKEKCNDGRGECIKLSECPKYRDFRRVNPNEIQYCSKPESIVCCIKSTRRASRPTLPSTLKSPSERACREYSLQASKNCKTAFIVNGIKADPKEFPHMALLGYHDDKGIIKWMCGGTLISPKFVLTAQHCFSDITLDYVRLGELDWNSTVDNANTQDFNISLYLPHPSNDDETKYNDITLVELDGIAIFNEYVFPACLSPTNGEEFKQFTAAGWGASKHAGEPMSHLMKVTLDRFTDKECIEKTSGIFEQLPEDIKIRTQMCAGSHDSSSDTCQGDSGGPLFVNHPNYNCMFIVVGITSFGSPICGIPGSPGIYTRVNLYTEWIERIVWKDKIMM